MFPGKNQSLEICRALPYGLVLRDTSNHEVLLPKRHCPFHAEVGSRLQVFVYFDSEDRLVATTQEPYGEVGDFCALQVVDVNRSGVFLDWGLDKDLLLPFAHQLHSLQKGEWVVVYIHFDVHSQRLIAIQKIRPFFARNTFKLHPGQKVELLVYEKSEWGYHAVINNQWTGLILPDPDSHLPDLEYGELTSGWVRRIQEDGRVDLSLQPVGYESIMDNTEQILSALQDAGGFLPIHDKSSPQEIEELFGLSKKAFKKLIGGLFKQGRIQIETTGIRLLSSNEKE